MLQADAEADEDTHAKRYALACLIDDAYLHLRYLARNVGDDRLLAWSLEDLRTLFGITAEPVDYLVQRWIDAMPQYGPGHADLVAEVRAGLPPNLAVAGGYLDGIGVPACVGSATRAAAQLVASGVAR